MESGHEATRRCYCGATAALLLCSPVLAFHRSADQNDIPGSDLLYRQARMGLDGVAFEMLKFRSMRVDAESQSGPVWAQPGDNDEELRWILLAENEP